MQRLPVNKYDCSKACTDRGRWKSRCRGCVEIALCRDTLFLFFWQGKTIMGYRSCGTRPNQMSSQEKTRTAILKVNWSNYASMVIKDLSLPETRATILDPSRLRLGHDFLFSNASSFSIFQLRNVRPCLVSQKFCKIFQIPRHIESLNTCMKY
jgi:hypothetical protein